MACACWVPNCLGVMVPGQGLNASLGHCLPRPGRLAFVAQSGTLVATVLDWALARGIGFSHLVSLGDMVDLDFGDLLDHLALDGGVSAILLFIESLGPARKFLSAARAAARLKPVILVKAGHTPAGGAGGPFSHRRPGRERCRPGRRLSSRRSAARAQPTGTVRCRDHPGPDPPAPGDRLVILTNSGGAGVLATDALLDSGGRLAELSDATRAALDEVLPAGWSRANPIDLLGDADGQRYARALNVLRTAPGWMRSWPCTAPAPASGRPPAPGPWSPPWRRPLSPVPGVAGEHPPLLASWMGGVSVSKGPPAPRRQPTAQL